MKNSIYGLFIIYFKQSFVILMKQETSWLESEKHLSQMTEPENYFVIADTKI